MLNKIVVAVLCLSLISSLSSCNKKKESDLTLRPVQTPTPFPSPTPGADPYYKYQWHLKNSGQFYGEDNEDINLGTTWTTYKGSGININVVDDGVQYAHPDLRSNISLKYSRNYVYTSTNDPTSPASSHGTCVAGLISARDNNSIGVAGVAPRATLAGLNVLGTNSSSSDSNLNDAMTRNLSTTSISNNSWGFTDATGQYVASAQSWRNAIDEGTSQGRKGKGIIYVWASGNGAVYDSYNTEEEVDRSSYDGLASYHGVNAICAVGNDGKKAYYSEGGSNVLVCTPSGNYDSFGDWYGVVTTDLTGSSGENVYGSSAGDFKNLSYTRFFAGTSAAAPIATGAIALLLNSKPTLTWRDVRIILARTARQNDISDPGWSTNAAGLHFHDSYGFGVIDITSAITLAKTWTSVGPSSSMKTENWPSAGPLSINQSIPDGSSGVSSTIAISTSSITALEYVDVYFETNHTSWGDLELTLKRDDGTNQTSYLLSAAHRCYSYSGSVERCGVSGRIGSWIFGSTRHIGESANANWTLTVRDKASGLTGTFKTWRLTFFGK